MNLHSVGNAWHRGATLYKMKSLKYRLKKHEVTITVSWSLVCSVLLIFHFLPASAVRCELMNGAVSDPRELPYVTPDLPASATTLTAVMFPRWPPAPPPLPRKTVRPSTCSSTQVQDVAWSTQVFIILLAARFRFLLPGPNVLRPAVLLLRLMLWKKAPQINAAKWPCSCELSQGTFVVLKSWGSFPHTFLLCLVQTGKKNP